MNFGTGIELSDTDDGVLGGYYKNAAVWCQFTAEGRIIPFIMKYTESSGQMITVEHIHVKQCDKKFYTGILVWKYRCEAMCGRTMKSFVLLFYPEECLWKFKMEQ